jgi:phage tail-like protein
MSDGGNGGDGGNEGTGNAAEGDSAPVDSQAQDDANAEQAVQQSGVTAPVDSAAAEQQAAEQGDEAIADSGVTAPVDNSQDEAAAQNQAAAALGATVWMNAGVMGSRINDDPGLAMFFSVTVDAIDLGTWMTCSGLGMSIEYTSRSEAAMTFIQHKLPGNLVYSNITLGRPITSDTAALMSWFSTYHMLPIPGAGEITLLDQTGSIIMSWSLMGVRPVSWKGPSLDAGSSSNLAMETLEISHMGFL